MTATVDELSGILAAAGLAVNTSLARAGESGTFAPIGLMVHHDAAGLSYVDGWDGRDVTTIAESMAPKGANGAQFWVGRSGAWYILSAGLKWHAGSGGPYGKIDADGGNRETYGIETDYGPVRAGWTGPTVTSVGYTWPQWDRAHREAIDRGSAALAAALGLSVFCGHKEYAPARKIDPANLDLNAWRRAIGAGPQLPEDDDVTDDDIERIAQRAAQLTVEQLLTKELDVNDAQRPDEAESAVATIWRQTLHYASLTLDRVNE